MCPAAAWEKNSKQEKFYKMVREAERQVKRDGK